MDIIIYILLCVLTIILLKFLLKINFKKAKELEKNKKLQEITDKLPENIDVAKEMLDMLDNKKVKIEEQKDTKTSLYIAITDKILIADLKDNYGRIGTVAHECLHSVQDRTLLLFNFIFSNITIVYYIRAIILTVCGVFTNYAMQIVILLIIGLIQFAIRAFLEIDAMTKSRYLAKEYILSKKVCTSEEMSDLIIEYDKINKMGISFIIYKLLSNLLIRIIIFNIIVLIVNGL